MLPFSNEVTIMFNRVRSLVGMGLVGVAIGVIALAITGASSYPRAHESGTTVAPPKTTDELLSKAQLIVVGEVGPVVQRRTFSGYGPNGEFLDGLNTVGQPVPQVPFTDFEVKVERVLRDDGSIASGKPIVLRMAGDATPEMKAITQNTHYPFSYTGDRHLFLLTLNPDKTTYGFYYGPWSRLLVDGSTLRVSDDTQQLLKLDGSDAAISLEALTQRIGK